MNGPLQPERHGDEEVPLVPLSPDLDQRQRAKALSQLSLQSEGSIDYDIKDAVDDDEAVGINLVKEKALGTRLGRHGNNKNNPLSLPLCL